MDHGAVPKVTLRRVDSRARVAVVLLVVAGCERHELTRPPATPVTSGGWTAIWLAAIVCGLVWAGLITYRAAQPNPEPRATRLLASYLFNAGGVVFLAALVYFVGLWFDARAILGGDACHEVPVDQRPHQIIQLTCIEGDRTHLSVLGLVLVPGIPLLACGFELARGITRPWVPAVVATGCVAGLGTLAIGATDATTSTVEWAALTAAVAAAAIATVICWAECARPRPPGRA